MDRLQKKCFMAATGMHVLLAVILLLGSAFMSRSPKQEEIQMIDFVPTVISDGAVGGGNPKADRAPAPRVVTPPAPPKEVAPAPVVKPQPKAVEPDPTPVKEKADPDSVEPVKHKRLPKVSTTVVNQKNAKPVKVKVDDGKAEEKRMADARRQLAAAIASAASEVQSGGSSATPIVIGDKGPGGGGPSYAGLESWIQKVYLDSWAPPEDTAKENAIAKASITIARDGSVIAFHVTTHSGDTSIDASVQKTLERVTTIGRAFPDSIKDKQRTYILLFDLRAKRSMA
jgi:outer membrane biosynthesis protein TonB